MANITITLTDAQVDALYHALGYISAGYTDNMVVDEEMGTTQWADTHKGIDEIQAKLDAKVELENLVEATAEAHPGYSMAAIRKACREVIKNK